MQKEIYCNLRAPTFTLEEELRCLIVNALFQDDYAVWDCRGETGSCNTPIMVDNIPMRPYVGDIPLMIGEDFNLIEIKLSAYRCSIRKETGRIQINRDALSITDHQWDLMLGGAGVLLIVAEPSLRALKLKIPKTETSEGCEEQLNKNYRSLLKKGIIKYDVWIFNTKTFTAFWEKYLQHEEIKEIERDKRIERRKTIPFGLLEFTPPNVYHTLTFSEIISSSIVRLIISNIE